MKSYKYSKKASSSLACFSHDLNTEALYDEFIEPTADIVRQKDEKFFLNLRELGELLKLVRMKETEEGVEAVMDEE